MLQGVDAVADGIDAVRDGIDGIRDGFGRLDPRDLQMDLRLAQFRSIEL